MINEDYLRMISIFFCLKKWLFTDILVTVIQYKNIIRVNLNPEYMKMR